MYNCGAPDCPKSFRTKGGCYKHYRIVHLNARSACATCGKVYRNGDDLRRHQERCNNAATPQSPEGQQQAEGNGSPTPPGERTVVVQVETPPAVVPRESDGERTAVVNPPANQVDDLEGDLVQIAQQLDTQTAGPAPRDTPEQETPLQRGFIYSPMYGRYQPSMCAYFHREAPDVHVNRVDNLPLVQDRRIHPQHHGGTPSVNFRAQAHSSTATIRKAIEKLDALVLPRCIYFGYRGDINL